MKAIISGIGGAHLAAIDSLRYSTHFTIGKSEPAIKLPSATEIFVEVKTKMDWKTKQVLFGLPEKQKTIAIKLKHRSFARPIFYRFQIPSDKTYQYIEGLKLFIQTAFYQEYEKAKNNN